MADLIYAEEIAFIVPAFEVADMLFEKGLGLDKIIQGKGHSSFWINDNTVLQCWLYESSSNRGLWGRSLKLSASFETIIKLAETLKEEKWKGDAILKRTEHENEPASLLLQVSTPKILTHVVLSTRRWPNLKNHTSEQALN